MESAVRYPDYRYRKVRSRIVIRWERTCPRVTVRSEPWFHRALSLALCMLLLLPHVSSAGANDDGANKFVVVLYPEASDGSPGLTLADRGIRSVFAKGSHGRVEIHNEYLNISRFPGESYQQELAKFLQRKYADRKVDLVIAGLASALDFAVTYRDEVFPNVPVVFFCVDEAEVRSRTLASDVIGSPITMELEATLALALQLHPRTQQVFVVVGNSRFDKHWEAIARDSFESMEKLPTVSNLAGLSMPELLNRVKNLPDRSVIYYLHVFEDGDGGVHVPADVLTELSAVANAPIYSHVDSYIGRGIVGGRVFRFEEEGRRAATLGLRLFDGETPRQIGIQETSENAYMFDWRQLQRWGIREAMLPPGSHIRHREPTMWDLYKWHLLGLLAVCSMQTFLIVALVTQRLRRARVEKELRANQCEFQVLAGELLVAQEGERRRLACELHDDFGQELALLSVEIALLDRARSENGDPFNPRIATISDRVKLLSSSIHQLSHQLHPMKLEQLGLAAAVRGLCKELTQTHSVSIQFVDGNLPERIPQDVALCLYRIAQESLRNVLKHSGAQHCIVELASSDDAICLRVRDDGAGFDPVAVDGRGGLGLISMRERLRAVGGEIVLDAKPRSGTQIMISIPARAPPSPVSHLHADSSNVK